MNKAEFVEALAERAGLNKAQAAMSIDAMTHIIGETLSKGEKVMLVGFGSFEAKNRAARTGRLIGSDNAPIEIPAKRVPVFKAGVALKNKVALAD